MGKMHNVFHVGLLKPYHVDSARAAFKPFVPQLADKRGLVFEVERIVDHRDVEVSRSGKGRAKKPQIVREYLVKWHGYPDADTSWEPESNLLGAADKMLETYRKSIGKVLLDQ
jgi:hypothetical protein